MGLVSFRNWLRQRARSSFGGPDGPSARRLVVAVLPLLGRVAADDLREQALLVVEQRQLALLELLEELVPGDLGQRVVLGLRVVREHDADDADVVALVRPLHRRRLAALALGPLADRVVVGRGLGHGSPRWLCCRLNAARQARTCREFRVWAGMIGAKEPRHAETQRAPDP